MFWKFGLVESSGESAQPLESVKTMIIAVSPVTDDSEKLDKEMKEDIVIQISQIKLGGMNPGSMTSSGDANHQGCTGIPHGHTKKTW